MAKFSNPWIEQLSGSLVMDWESARDEMDYAANDQERAALLEVQRNVEAMQDRLRLFDAVDELLAALKDAAQELSLVCKWFDHPEQTTTETLRRATSAINKAEGGQGSCQPTVE